MKNYYTKITVSKWVAALISVYRAVSQNHITNIVGTRKKTTMLKFSPTCCFSHPAELKSKSTRSSQ